jgi:Fe-S-cluster containining protein
MQTPKEGLSAEVRSELEEVYRDLDREVRGLGVGCWLRGDCCDFERSEHRLYASSVEIAYVSEKHPEAFSGPSALCPFWKEGKCTERERRPLGCRTYFCDARYRDPLQDLYEKHYRRLQGLAERHQLAWSYVEFVAALRNREAP